MNTSTQSAGSKDTELQLTQAEALLMDSYRNMSKDQQYFAHLFCMRLADDNQREIGMKQTKSKRPTNKRPALRLIHGGAA